MVAEGRGHEIVTMQYGFAPMSANRYLSLTQKGGADDMFSSDFTVSSRSRVVTVGVLPWSAIGTGIFTVDPSEESSSTRSRSVVPWLRKLTSLPSSELSIAIDYTVLGML